MDKSLQTEAADAMLSATITFLLKQRVPSTWIAERAAQIVQSSAPPTENAKFERRYREYQEMGAILATWYNAPKYLDDKGRPSPLTATSSAGISVQSLIVDTSVPMTLARVVQYLKLSPSIRRTRQGLYVPRRRVFVLKGFELPRAAKLISKYLGTLTFNAEARNNNKLRMLERDCFAAGLSDQAIFKIQREIRTRGKPFVDAIDHELESERSRRKRTAGGETGLLVFSWATTGCGIYGKTRGKRKYK